MEHEVEHGKRASICDEIAVLAELHLMEPGARGLQRIDQHIAAAMADSRWDEMSKWHRVRFRLVRLQQARLLASRGEPGCESRAAS